MKRHFILRFAPLAAALWPLSVPAGAQVQTTAGVVWGQGGSFTAHTTNNGGISAISLDGPTAVVVDGTGNLYVADSTNNRVLYFAAGNTTATRVYGQGGSFATNSVNEGLTSPSADTLSGPTGLALDADGDLYIADKGNNRVLYYAAGSTTATRVYGQGGSFITATINNGGISATGLDGPIGVALDADSDLYVADSLNNRVLYYPAGTTTATKVYGQAGAFTSRAVNKNGISASSLDGPTGVALDANGNVYLADRVNNRVLYYAAASTIATQVYGQGGSFTTGTANTGGISDTTLDLPNTVALDGSGNLYVADTGNNRVLYYPASNTTASQVYGQTNFTGRFSNGGFTPTAATVSAPYVALDSRGNLYVGDSGNNRLLEFFTPAALSLSTTHSSPIYQGGPGSIALTVANSGGPTAGTATVTDTLTADFTINSVSSGCSISGQTVTCTLGAGRSAVSTSFTVYVTASTSASTAGIANDPTLSDASDTITTGSASDTITVVAQLPQADESFSQVVLSGSTDNGTCAAGNRTLTATDQIQNTSGSTVNNPYAEIVTLSGGNTLTSQSANVTSVAPNANVTFTFHIQLASCESFQIVFRRLWRLAQRDPPSRNEALNFMKRTFLLFLASLTLLAQTETRKHPGETAFEFATTQNATQLGKSFVVGADFTVTSPIVLTELGAVLKSGGAQPIFGALPSSVQVGLWDQTKTLLALATVTGANPLIGHFNYAQVQGVQLLPGVTYTIGALIPAGQSVLSDVPEMVAGSVVKYGKPHSFASSSLVFPDGDQIGIRGNYFGAGFLFQGGTAAQ